MEIAAFASFAALVVAWIILPVRAGTPATATKAPATVPEAIAA